MEEVSRRTEAMDTNVLMTVMCDPQNCLSIDVRRTAQSFHDFATVMQTANPPTPAELSSTVYNAILRVVNEGSNFTSAIGRARQLVQAPSERKSDFLSSVRCIQVKELHKQAMLHMKDISEAARRTDPFDTTQTTRRTSREFAWWASASTHSHESVCQDTRAACYTAMGLQPVVSCEVVDEDKHILCLDAMGLSYMCNGTWKGFVREVALVLEQGEAKSGRIQVSLNAGEWVFYVKNVWRESGRFLRSVAAVAACSGVPLQADGIDVIPWLLNADEKTEVGLRVAVWYSEADAAREGWYTGVVEGFNTTTGRYVVHFNTGELAENVHPSSVFYSKGPLIGHFWSSSSPIWRDKKQVVLQGITRSLARRYDDNKSESFFSGYLGGLEKSEALSLAVKFCGGDEAAMWKELLAVVLRVGLVCVACNVLFQGLINFIFFTTPPDSRSVCLPSEPVSEITKTLAFIASCSALPPALPDTLPTIRLSNGVVNKHDLEMLAEEMDSVYMS